VVFSTSGYAIENEEGADESAAGILVGGLADSGVSHAVIAPETSAQKLLGVTPRTASEWLADMGLR
jgi:hypothetical protein